MYHQRFKSQRERFDEKWEQDPAGECWLWKGCLDSNGYGMIYWSAEQRNVKAHAASMCLYRDIPIKSNRNGKEWDHLCRTHACVNPDHLELVSRRENVLRGVSPSANKARQTHCANGHPLSGSNLLKPTPAQKSTNRRCRKCQRIREKKYYDLRKM